jgi:nitroreductase
MRAPTIVVVIACVKDHPKIPQIEQVISAGAAAQNMLTAAYAQGLGAIWRTGDMAYDAICSAGLGLAVNEQIVGFLYLGAMPNDRDLKVQKMNTDDYFKCWP